MKRRNFMRFLEAKAYGSQLPGNPLFPRKELAFRWWLPVCALILVGLSFGGLATLLFGPYLKLTNVIVSGASTLSADDIAAKVQSELDRKRFYFVPNDQRFVFDVSQAESELISSFPLKSVSVQKQGDTLQVEIVEDIFMLAFRSGDEVFFLDPSGTIIRIADPVETATILVRLGEVAAPTDGQEVLANLQAGMPVLRAKTAGAHVVGDQVFDASLIENLIAFSDGLTALGVMPKEFISDDLALPWFTVSSNLDYAILFDASESVVTQLAVLQAVMRDEAILQAKPRYIDVRFGSRVFVR
jgi:cell division septal protein FtsQ